MGNQPSSSSPSAAAAGETVDAAQAGASARVEDDDDSRLGISRLDAIGVGKEEAAGSAPTHLVLGERHALTSLNLLPSCQLLFASPMQSVQYVSLRLAELDATKLNHLSQNLLRQQKSLHTLVIDWSAAPPSAVAALCSRLSGLTSLEAFAGRFTLVDERDAQELDNLLRAQPALKRLKLEPINGVSCCWTTLSEQSSQSLVRLHVQYHLQPNLEAISALGAALPAFSNLSHLTVDWLTLSALDRAESQLDKSAVSALCAGLRQLSGITKLRLWWQPEDIAVDAATARLLASALSSQPQLASLELRGLALGDGVSNALFGALSPLPAAQLLQTLLWTQKTDTSRRGADIEALGSLLRQLTSLTSLHLELHHCSKERFLDVWHSLTDLTALDRLHIAVESVTQQQLEEQGSGISAPVSVMAAWSALSTFTFCVKLSENVNHSELLQAAIASLSTLPQPHKMRTLQLSSGPSLMRSQSALPSSTAQLLGRALSKLCQVTSLKVDCVFADSDWCLVLDGLQDIRVLDELQLPSFDSRLRQCQELLVNIITKNRQLSRVNLGSERLSQALQQPLTGLGQVAGLTDQELLTYLHSLEKAGSVYRHKLMLVGYGSMGKTCLLRSLKDDSAEVVKKVLSTHGIDISPWCLNSSKGDKMILSCWDFAGQEEYYATHSLFLSSGCLYLLVWDPLTQDAGEGVLYWLRSIKACDPTAHVFVVATHRDRMSRASTRDQPPRVNGLRKDTEFAGMQLRSFFIGNPPRAEEWSDRQQDLVYLRQAIRAHVEDHGFLRLADSWRDLSVRMDQERASRKLAQKVSTAEVKLWARDAHVPERELDAAINMLRNWGALLRYRFLKHDGDDFCVLDPQWLSNLARQLVSATITSNQQAVMTRDEIVELWKDLIPDGYYPDLLRLMHEFELSFALHNEKELVPALLRATPTDEEQDSVTELLKVGKLRQCRFELSFVPANLMPLVIHRSHKFTVRYKAAMHACWKNFVVLKKDGQVVNIVLEQRNSMLYIYVAGSAPVYTCALLGDMVQEVLSGLSLTASRLIGCWLCKDKVQFIHADSAGVEEVLPCPRCKSLLPMKEFAELVGFRSESGYHADTAVAGVTGAALVEHMERLERLMLDAATKRELDRQLIMDVFHHAQQAAQEGQRAVQGVASAQRATLNLLQALHRTIEQREERITPRIIYILPRRPATGLQRFNPVKAVEGLLYTQWELYLMCENPDQMHDIKQEPYQVQLSKPTWTTLAPVLRWGLMAAQIALAAIPLAAPAGTAAGLASDALKAKQERDATMSLILKQVEACCAQPSTAADGHLKQEGAALRAFSKWLVAVDDNRGFQQLVWRTSKTGEVCWVCSDCALLLGESKVRQNESLNNTPPLTQPVSPSHADASGAQPTAPIATASGNSQPRRRPSAPLLRR